MAGAVYWIGQDNNIWYKDGSGTRNMGRADATVTRPDDTGFYDPWAESIDSAVRTNATRIDDPMVQQETTNTAPTGGSTAPQYKEFNEAAANNTQKAIDQIPGLIQAALTAEQQKYQNTLRDFAQQEQSQRGQYDQSSTTNMQNYDANMMDSVRAGVRGLSGLMNLLRGTGVEDQARDIVSNQASQDIRQGYDTRTENQTQLDNTLSSFLTDLGRKKEANEDAFENNQRAARRDYNSQLQDLYGKMAGFYSEAGQKDNATNWMNKAGSLTPEIGRDSRVQVSNYDTAPVQVKAPEISAFTAPTEQAVTSTNTNGQLGSGIFTVNSNDDRRRDRGQNLNLVGA